MEIKKLKEAIRDLLSYQEEQDWFEFKGNWFEPVGVGEYISSLANAAALVGRECAYMIWGVNDKTHKIIGTQFNYHINVKNEPLEHFLARQLLPDLAFEFREVEMENERLVVLIIPAAKHTPISFGGTRFLRIGSSKVNLFKYPEREAKLFDVLRNGLPSMTGTDADTQELTFHKLFLYYEDRGVSLNKRTFEKNYLRFKAKNGSYNLLAQLLSDNNGIPLRVSLFTGKDKTSVLYAVREFGNNCLLLSLEKLLDYADVLNVNRADERHRKMIRKEVTLFNKSAFREALVNAFVHNSWVDKNAPMISVYSDRIEILSHGKLPPSQTINGFFMGESVPVNRE